MKFGQLLVCCMTNISNKSLMQWPKTGNGSRLFYDFIKIAIQRDLALFMFLKKINKQQWKMVNVPFLIVAYSPFSK